MNDHKEAMQLLAEARSALDHGLLSAWCSDLDERICAHLRANHPPVAIESQGNAITGDATAHTGQIVTDGFAPEDEPDDCADSKVSLA